MILVSILLLFFSCSKYNMNITDTDNTVKKIDFAQINIVISNNSKMLAFASWADFNNVVSVLAEQTNAHTQNYLAPLIAQGLVDDDLTDKMTLDGFNSFQPLHAFNNTLSFESYFQVAEQQEILWLQNSELNIATDPFKDVEVFQSALLNKDGEVMIGTEVFKAGEANSNSCSFWDGKSSWSSVYGFVGKNRLLKFWIGISPGAAHSSTKAYYKKSNGNWAFWFTNEISSNIYGQKRSHLYNGECGDLDVDINPRASKIFGFYTFASNLDLNLTSAAIRDEYTVKSNHSAPNSGIISLNY